MNEQCLREGLDLAEQIQYVSRITENATKM
jgi:hypothetical protein